MKQEKTIMELLEELLALTKKLEEEVKEFPTMAETIQRIAEATIPPSPEELK